MKKYRSQLCAKSSYSSVNRNRKSPPEKRTNEQTNATLHCFNHCDIPVKPSFSSYSCLFREEFKSLALASVVVLNCPPPFPPVCRCSFQLFQLCCPYDRLWGKDSHSLELDPHPYPQNIYETTLKKPKENFVYVHAHVYLCVRKYTGVCEKMFQWIMHVCGFFWKSFGLWARVLNCSCQLSLQLQQSYFRLFCSFVCRSRKNNKHQLFYIIRILKQQVKLNVRVVISNTRRENIGQWGK